MSSSVIGNVWPLVETCAATFIPQSQCFPRLIDGSGVGHLLVRRLKEHMSLNHITTLKETYHQKKRLWVEACSVRWMRELPSERGERFREVGDCPQRDTAAGGCAPAASLLDRPTTW
jgi:hypothetical protein